MNPQPQRERRNRLAYADPNERGQPRTARSSSTLRPEHKGQAAKTVTSERVFPVLFLRETRCSMGNGSIEGASSLPILGEKTETRASLLSFLHILVGHATENVTTNYLTNIDYHSSSPNNILTIQYTTTSITIMTLSFPSRREQSFHPSAMPLQHKYVPFPSFFLANHTTSTNKLRKRKGKCEV